MTTALVRYFKLTAPAAVLGHLGVISLKNLTKCKEVRKLEKELIRPNILCSISKYEHFGKVSSP